MAESYISKIIVLNSNIFGSVEIDIDSNQKKHVIITGKNGSGKTTLLNMIASHLSFADYNYHDPNIPYNEFVPPHYEQNKKSISPVKILLTDDFKKTIGYKFLHFRSNREMIMVDKFALNNVPGHPKQSSSIIENELLKKKVQHVLSVEKGVSGVEYSLFEEKITTVLKKILEREDVLLEFDIDKFVYGIIIGENKVHFSQLSDGIKSILAYLGNILTYMGSSFLIKGIILIDEIDAHLHVSLQKNILVILTELFPNIQFIVSTHSPFVINSIEEAVVYDIEKKVRIDDASSYSYDAIIEAYFGISKYSDKILKEIDEYERLAKINEKNKEEKIRFFELDHYFNNLPLPFSKELNSKIYDIKREIRNRK